MKIAIVLPEELKIIFENKISDHPDLEAEYYVYEQDKEIRPLVYKINANKVDGIIFTGLLSYERCYDMEIVQEKPVYCIPYDALNLLKILVFLKEQKIKLDEVSFDTANERTFMDAFSDAGYNERKPINILEFDPRDELSYVVEFHQRLYREGVTKYAVTSLSSCLKQLKEDNIPCCAISPTGVSVRQSLEYMDRENKYNMDKGKLPAIVLIEKKIDNNLATVRAIKSIRERIKKHLDKMSKMLRGYYIDLSQTHALIITNRQYVSAMTNRFNFEFTVFKEIEGLKSLQLNMGIGIDAIFSRAMENAKVALNASKEIPHNNCMIITEDEELIGPLKKKKLDVLKGRVSIEESRKMALAANASTETMMLIFNAIYSLNGEFTINDLESFISLNRKSLERIIRQLLHNGYLSVVGQETKNKKGKPCRIYQLKQMDKKEE